MAARRCPNGGLKDDFRRKNFFHESSGNFCAFAIPFALFSLGPFLFISDLKGGGESVGVMCTIQSTHGLKAWRKGFGSPLENFLGVRYGRFST